MNKTILDAALWYASNGWYVMPLHSVLPSGACSCQNGFNCPSKGKHPRFTAWEHEATIDAQKIKRWWGQNPDANVGLAVGKSCLVAIDVDTYKGADITQLPVDACELETIIARTGGGGKHVLYKKGPNEHITNRDTAFPEFVEVRADGGIIVLPPSKHESGNVYEWEIGSGPHETKPLPIPAEIKKLLHYKTERIEEPKKKRTSLSVIHEGQRDVALTSLAGHLRRIGFDASEMENSLNLINVNRCVPPLSTDDIKKISYSIGSKPAETEIGDDSTNVVAISIKDLLAKNIPSKNPILSPWLMEQNLAMISSWRGVGKTQVSVGIAVAVAGGLSFLGWEADRPRKVLFVDGELPLFDIQTRFYEAIRRHKTGGQITAQKLEQLLENITIITPDMQDNIMPNLGTIEGQTRIAEHVKDVDLVILDNLSTLTGGLAENDSQEWEVMQTWLLSLRKQGKAVVFFHHTGKNGSQRGTSRREDILDVIIKLKHGDNYREEDGAKFELCFSKARGLSGKAVRSIEAHLTCDEFGNEQWALSVPSIGARDMVLELHQAGKSKTEISNICGISRQRVYQILGSETTAVSTPPPL